MKIVVRVLALLFVVCGFAFSMVSSVVAQPNDDCEDRLYYLDREVVWCQPEGWHYWYSFWDSEDELEAILQEEYDWDLSELMTFGDDELVAAAIHSPVSEWAMYVLVFRDSEGFPEGYETAEAVIGDFSITFGDGEEVAYELIAACSSPCGEVQRASESAHRIFLLYPFPETGEMYTTVLYAHKDAWGTPALLDEMTDIAFSLFAANQPWSDAPTDDESSTSANHPVFVGGEILSVTEATQTAQDTVLGERTKPYTGLEDVFTGAVLEFMADGRTVIFTPQGIGSTVREDLFPVSGTYSMNGVTANLSNGVLSIEGGTLNFELYKESSIDGNTSYVWITGTLDNETGIADINYQVSSGRSATSVNGAQTQVVTVNATFTQEWYK
jgi:hypothetical protein